MKLTTIAVVFLALTFPALQSQGNPRVPATWKRAEACGVRFYLPSDVTAPHRGEIGLDECAEIFESQTIRMSLETDPFPFKASKTSITRFNSLAHKENFKRIETKIGSHEAIVVKYYDPNSEGFSYHSALSIAAKGGFRMFFSMKSSDDQFTVEKIFRSMVFSAEGQPTKKPSD